MKYLNTAIEIGQAVAREFANKTKTDYSDFLSVVNYKIPLVLEKVDGERNPKSFIRKCLTGYCLNYIRDSLSIVRLPRDVTNSYLQNRKYDQFNPEGSSSYNVEIPIDSLISTTELNDYSEFVASDVKDDPAMEALYTLSYRDRSLLMDYYVKGLKATTMSKKYGAFYEQKVKTLTAELRELAES